MFLTFPTNYGAGARRYARLLTTYHPEEQKNDLPRVEHNTVETTGGVGR